jgi:HSP20 family protein
MLIETDPFRDIDALFNRLSGRANGIAGTMPMDAYRRGGDVWVDIDLPGVSVDSLDVSVERNVLTVVGERNWQRQEGDQVYLAERQRGAFRRQIHLGDGLDADGLDADYHDGVLTLRIPIAEQAKPRKIEVKARQSALEAGSSPA